MARLVFTEENHEYEVDGQIVPSVSEICRFISREIYSDAPQFQLERAADRGTRIHKITESLDRYGDAEAEIGRVCVQLANPDFKYLSGETLTLEGGMGLRP